MTERAKDSSEKAIAVWYMPSPLLQHDDWPRNFSLELENGHWWNQKVEGGLHHLSVDPIKPERHTECKYFLENDAFYDCYKDIVFNIGEDTIFAVSMLDGCRNLKQIINRLRGAAKLYEQKLEEGWELEGPMKDDYGFMRMGMKKVDAGSLKGATIVRVDA